MDVRKLSRIIGAEPSPRHVLLERQIRVTALNGERFRLRDARDTRRFLQAVVRLADEATS